MKKIVLFFICLICGFTLYAEPSIWVVTFNSNNYCTEQNAIIMTDLFRNELVRSGRGSVVDRRNMDVLQAELKFQMEDWVDPTRMAQAGKMIGADYIITGSFDMLGDTLHLVAQMVDISTSRIFHSSRMSLAAWAEYDRKVKGFAEEFINKIPLENFFIGEWAASSGGFSYNIVLMHSNMCIITVKTVQNGREIEADANGTWSYDKDFLRINGNFSNSGIKGLTGINWSSLYRFNNTDNSSFNIMIPSPVNNKESTRVNFARIIKWE
jgi:TolB-like protein